MNKDFSIDFLDFFFKKFKINKKNIEFKNKFLFPLDEFFYIFFKLIFLNFFFKKKIKLINFKLILNFLIKRFLLKIRKLKYNSRDLFYP